VPAVLGAAVVVGMFSSILRTLVIPRPTRSRFTSFVHGAIRAPFHAVADRCRTAEAKDRVLAPVAPLSILITLIAWLVCLLVGYALLEAATGRMGATGALREAGSSLFTLGFASTNRGALTAVDFCAAATGPIVVGLQVGYLPALYGAYARRETEVTLLHSRAGSPPWGPEILARYAQVNLLASIDDLFRDWERWSADVSESHTSYPVLVQFRSPRASRNWLIALLAVLDAAALRLALTPSMPQAQVRLALRAGFVCLRDIADSRAIPYDPDPSPEGRLELDFEDFRGGVAHLAAVGYPVERTPEAAWLHFRGWRVNYEALAYRIAHDIEAVPAPWSGPRRRTLSTITPITPADRVPSGTG
jgi:hypothetical protein